MKIRAELLLIGHEEDIGAFLFKKKAMLMNSPGRSANHIILSRLKSQRPMKPFMTELNNWTLAQDRLRTRGTGKKTRDDFTHTGGST